MNPRLAEDAIRAFENGNLTRRQLASWLMGLGAAASVSGRAFGADGDEGSSMFQATAVDHVALDVTDVPRSMEFYSQHLGLKRTGGDGKSRAFMAPGDKSAFCLALFGAETAGLNHYAYAIKNYQPDEAMKKLEAANLQPRREQGRVYFKDPDGIEVQIM